MNQHYVTYTCIKNKTKQKTINHTGYPSLLNAITNAVFFVTFVLFVCVSDFKLLHVSNVHVYAVALALICLL